MGGGKGVWFGYSCLTPNCLRGGSGGDGDPRRWAGKTETVAKAALSPAE